MDEMQAYRNGIERRVSNRRKRERRPPVNEPPKFWRALIIDAVFIAAILTWTLLALK